MNPEEEWTRIRGKRGWRAADSGVSLIRVVLLFGFVAVAFAMILVPIIDEGNGQYWSRNDAPVGLDDIQTGQIGRRDNYTLRRSVLQRSPNSVCLIRDNGQRKGDC